MKNKYIIIFLLIAAGALLLFLRINKGKIVNVPSISENTATTSNPIQSGKINEHLTIDNELKAVNFCGKNYRVKQVIIDGVDVVQRIAELATSELIPKNIQNGSAAENICRNIELNTPVSLPGGSELTIGEVKKFSGKDVGQNGDMYAVNISALRFSISVVSSEIYLNSNFDGSLIGPIGKLK